MIRKLYDWTIDLAQRPYAMWALFVYAMAEAVFFPLPVELIMIPMIIANRQQALRVGVVTIVGSIAGAIIGYWIGAALYETIGRPILEFYHATEKFGDIQALYDKWGVFAVAIGALTPLPFKLVTIFSGLVGFAFVPFLLSVALARGVRYGIVAGLLYFIGKPARIFIEKHLGLVFLAFMVLLIGGFLALGLI